MDRTPAKVLPPSVGKPPAPRRLTPEALEVALALQAAFWTRRQIAEELGFHPSTISRALAKHNQAALARLEKQTAGIKARQVRQLETIAREAFEAWTASKTRKLVERTVTSPDKQGGTQKTKTREKSDHHADPSLLNQVRGALADIREVLGIKGEKTKVATSPLVDAIRALLNQDVESEDAVP